MVYNTGSKGVQLKAKKLLKLQWLINLTEALLPWWNPQPDFSIAVYDTHLSTWVDDILQTVCICIHSSCSYSSPKDHDPSSVHLIRCIGEFRNNRVFPSAQTRCSIHSWYLHFYEMGPFCLEIPKETPVGTCKYANRGNWGWPTWISNSSCHTGDLQLLKVGQPVLDDKHVLIHTNTHEIPNPRWFLFWRVYSWLDSRRHIISC